MEGKILLKLLDSGKWWFVPVALSVSIVLLSRYLWVVGHAELITDSISSPPFLLVWLFFSILGFLALIWVACVPSIIFLLTMSAIKIDRAFEADVAKRFLLIVLLGFCGFSFGLLMATFREYPVWWIFIGVSVLVMVGLALICRVDAEFRIVVVGLDNNINKFSRVMRFLGIAIALGLTALCGVFPGQLALMVWRGGEAGWEGRSAILLCLFMMAVYFFPVVYYYCVSGSFFSRVSKASIVLLFSFVFNVMAFPALSDVFVYAAASMLKIRDSRVVDYVISDKDYPTNIFNKDEWSLSRIKGSEGLYRLTAFRQFKFANILLVCPGKYSSVRLKNIDSYADKCVSLDSSKIKLVIEKIKAINGYSVMPACALIVVRPANVPYLWEHKGQCAYGFPGRAETN